MIRSPVLNALMVFLGALALLALVPAFDKGGLDAFWTALPGVSQALGGLLAIYATYQIAARSEERAKRFEEETAARETRFDERAEARSIRADAAADQRMEAADKSALRRSRATERKVVRDFVLVTAALVAEAEALVTDQLSRIDQGGYAAGIEMAHGLDAVADAIEAVTRVTVNDAKLLRAVFDARRIMRTRPNISHGVSAQPGIRAQLDEYRSSFVRARMRILLFAPK